MTKKRSRSAASPLLLFVLGWTAFVLAPGISLAMEEDTSNSYPGAWYQRYYPYYPPYCATPEEMQHRAITPPPFDIDDDNPNIPRVGESRLVHASVVLRHGARTPHRGDMTCWDKDILGSDADPNDDIWDCSLYAYLSPPPPSAIAREEHKQYDGSTSMFLFEKIYNALKDPNNLLSNTLNGTCQLGQLLLQGYEQERTNGIYLRQAYLYDSTAPPSAHDARMRLLDVQEANQLYERPTSLYFRADDMERTIMSGQVVLRGLFGPEMQAHFQAHSSSNSGNNNNNNKRHSDASSNTHAAGDVLPKIVLHTANIDHAIFFPNPNLCPRLTELMERFEASDAYQAYQDSAEVKQLNAFIDEVLFPHSIPGTMEFGGIDCLMTTMCTDRTLPDVLNDYRGPSSSDEEEENSAEDTTATHNPYGSNLFQRLYRHYSRLDGMRLAAASGELAKLAMIPMWSEIMHHIYAAIQRPTPTTAILPPASTPPAKLAMFSGHDSTIMPLLMALDPNIFDDAEFPNYATMVVIEIHEINIDGRMDKRVFSSDFAFRLLYNGQSRTHRVTGCPSQGELCDANILVERVERFTTITGQDHAAHAGRFGVDPDHRYSMLCRPIHSQTNNAYGTAAALQKGSEFFDTPGSVALVVGVILMSFVVGAVTTSFFLVGASAFCSMLCVWLRRCCGRESQPQQQDASWLEEDGVALTAG